MWVCKKCRQRKKIGKLFFVRWQNPCSGGKKLESNKLFVFSGNLFADCKYRDKERETSGKERAGRESERARERSKEEECEWYQAGWYVS